MEYTVMFYHPGEVPSGVRAGTAPLELIYQIIKEMKIKTNFSPMVTIISDNDGKVVDIQIEQEIII